MRKRRRRFAIAIAITVFGLFAILVYLPAFPVRFASEAKTFLFSSYKSSDRHDLQDECEILSIAIVCAGFESTNRFVILLKSILDSRTNGLDLHLVVDDIAGDILGKLFETWLLPAVSVNFYNLTANLNRVAWIPNRHYSGAYGLVKLALPDLLPTNLDKVLVVDTDVLIVSNIAELWRHWKSMNTSQALGLVENLSEWYLDSDDGRRQPWPALERGFNTGVILMNLKNLRSMRWLRLWRAIATKNLQNYGATHLADQDVVNAVIAEEPWILYRLPCVWNYQMGFQSLPSLCNATITDLKLIHWNSPLKMHADGQWSRYFQRLHREIVQIDGNRFRRRKTLCGGQLEVEKVGLLDYDTSNNGAADDDGCDELRRSGRTIFRTQLFVVPFVHREIGCDITLVTQLSLDRLVLFETLLSHWKGPISAAVYVSDTELAQVLQYASLSQQFASRTNIAIHAVFKEGMHFPINYLRNIALLAARTQFVFLVDVDFLPNIGLYDILRLRLNRTRVDAMRTFVIPAFEFRAPIAVFPETKKDLLDHWDAGRIDIFRHDIWTKGHAATNYDRWRISTQPYRVNWRMDYEPYIVMRRNATPLYDHRFIGFGWNKVSHIMTLNVLGFDFSVLPDGFLLHQAHTPSLDVKSFRNSPLYRRCIKAVKGEFVRDLIRWKNSITKNGKNATIATPRSHYKTPKIRK